MAGQLTPAQISSIAASQVTGQLTDSQILAVSAAKVSGVLTDGQLGAISAAKVTGQLTASQIASINATQVAGQLTPAQISSIAASQVTGQLVASQISPAAITADKLLVSLGGGNLTQNSSFETISTGGILAAGWNIYNNSGSAVPTSSAMVAGRLGGLAQKIYWSTNNNGNVKGITGTVCPAGWGTGKTYILSFYATTANLNISTAMFLGWNIFPISVTPLLNPLLSTSWQRYAFRIVWGGTVEPLGNAFVSIANWVASVGEVIFDDFQVTDGDTLTGYAPMVGEILPSAVTSLQLSDNAVTAAKTNLASISSTTGNLNPNTVSSAQLVASAVTSVQLAAGAVTAAKTAIAAIDSTSGNLTANSVTAAQISAGAVTAAAIQSGSVTAAQIAAGTITGTQIAANSVTASNINSNGLAIRDVNGNLILGAGSVLPLSYAAVGTVNSAISLSSSGTLSGAGGGAVTLGGLGSTGVVGSGNLLQNSDFLLSGGGVPSGFAVYNNSQIAISPAVAASGPIGNSNYCGLVAAAAGGTTFGLYIQNNVTQFGGFKANTNYIISLYACANGALVGGGMRINWNHGPTTLIALQNPGLDGGWQRYAFLVNFGSATIDSQMFISSANYPANGNALNLACLQIEQGDLPSGWSPVAVSTSNPLTASNVSTYIASAAIGSAQVGQLTAANIYAGAITSTQIAAGSITSDRIATNSLTANQIAGNTIVGWNIAANTITAANISAGTITAAQIAAGGVTANSLAANSVSTAALQAGSVTTSALAASSVVAGNIAANAITTPAISAGAVTATQVAVGSLTGDRLAANTITSDRIATNSLTANQIAGNTIVGWNIAANTITAANISAGTITAAQIAAGGVTANSLAANSVSTAALQAGAVTAGQIAAGAITSDKLYVGSTGSALNADPTCSDINAWVGGAAIVTLTDGQVGNTALRSSASGSYEQSAKRFPIDPSKIYRIKCWARKNSATNGLLYLGVSLADSSGANIAGNGTFWYVAAVGVAGNTAWTSYAGFIGAGQSLVIPATAKTAQMLALLNYGGTTGYHEIQDFRIEEVLPGTLIQDGAISTSKILAGAVTADRILSNSITAAQLAVGSVTANQLAASSVTTAALAAGAVTASTIAVGSLSAISGNLGYITSGDIYSGSIHGGSGYPTGGFTWPTNGGTGYSLSSGGLLLGNYYAGQYVEIDSNGSFYAPGMSIAGGKLTISQANVIDTLQVSGGAITAIQASTAAGRGLVRTTITVLPGHIPSGQSAVPIIVTGSQDVFSQTYFDIGVNMGSYGVGGNLCWATPPTGGTWSYTVVYNASPGTYEFVCYNHGAGDADDSNTRQRTITALLGKR